MSIARSPARVVLVAVLALAGCQRGWHAAERVALVADADGLRLAVASSGHAIAVWQQDTAADPDGEIWAARRDPDGSWTLPERIGTGHDPFGAVDPSGGAVVVWQQGLFEASRVSASRHTLAGWGLGELLDPARSEDIHVAMDAAGNALAVFDAEQGVLARLHDGSGWRAPEVVDATPGTGPRIAMNEAGDAFAYWTDIRPDGADDVEYFIRVSRRGPDGTWSQATTLGGSQTIGAAVVVADDGNALAFWNDQNAGIWMERFVEPGGWQGARQLATGGRSVAAAGDGDGNAAVAWLYIDDEIRAAYLSDGEPGDTVTLSRAELDDPAIGQGDLDVAAGGGDAIAIWRRATRIEGSHGDPTGWDPPIVLDDGLVGGPQVEMFGSGDALAVWLRRIDDDSVEIRSRTYR